MSNWKLSDCTMSSGDLLAAPTLSNESSHHARLGEHAVSLWKRNHMTDIVVYVEGQPFPAHRAVLSCYSPYFKRILPVNEDKPKLLELRSVSSDVFEVILKYMYEGKMAVNCQNLADVYRASRHLEIKEIMMYCLEVLSGSAANPRTIIYVYCAAKKLSIRDTCHRALNAMGTKFEEIIVIPEFLDLSLDQICEILSLDVIGTRREIVLFLATLKWLSNSFSEREKCIGEVMNCIRFSLMSPEEVLACFRPPILPQIADYHQVKNKLMNAICYLTAKQCGREDRFSDYASPPRVFLFKNEPFELWTSEEYKEFTPFVPEDKNYFQQSELNDQLIKLPFENNSMDSNPLDIQELTDAQAQEFLKQVDDNDENVLTTGTVHTYLNKELKTTSSNLLANSELNDFPLKALNKVTGVITMPTTPTLLAAGGLYSHSGKLNGTAILRYNPSSDKWERCGKLPVSRHHHSLVYLAGDLYLIGGCDTLNTVVSNNMIPTNKCFRYQIQSQKWQQLKDMNHARVYHGVAVFCGTIYVIGGKDETGKLLSSIEYFCKDFDGWIEMKQPLCCPRMAMGTAVFQGMLWVVGGMIQPTEEDRVYIIHDVECFNPRLNRWIFDKPKLPAPRSFCSLVECGKYLFVIGGTSCCDKSSDNYFSSKADVFRFDTDTEEWVADIQLPSPAHGMAVASIDDNIYVMGGLSTYQVTSLREVYSMGLCDTQWSPCQSLPLSNSGLSCTVIPSGNSLMASTMALEEPPIKV